MHLLFSKRTKALRISSRFMKKRFGLILWPVTNQRRVRQGGSTLTAFVFDVRPLYWWLRNVHCADDGFILYKNRDWSSRWLGQSVLDARNHWLIVFSFVTFTVSSMRQKKGSSSSTSPCAHLRDAYHNCFNRFQSSTNDFFFFRSFFLFFFFNFTSSPKFCCILRLSLTLTFSGRWYAEKFMKGQWDKEECLSEWEKYRACLSVWSMTTLIRLSLYCVIYLSNISLLLLILTAIFGR